MPRRMPPIAEAVLRAAGKAGRKAIESAALEGLTAAADSVLEDVETSTGGMAAKARDVRDRLRERKEETMGKRRRAEEEEEEEVEEEEEDEEEDDDGEDVVLMTDTECHIRTALYLLDAAVSKDKAPKKLLRKLEEVHEEIVDLIDEQD